MITKGLMKNHRCQRSSMDWIMPMSVLLIVCKEKHLISECGHCIHFIFITHTIYVYTFILLFLHVLKSAGNFNEQLVPFIISLFLYSTFVSVKGACYLGWAWLFFRSYYFIVYGWGIPFLFLSTIPAYCCIWGMLFGTVWELSKSHSGNILPK